MDVVERMVNKPPCDICRRIKGARGVAPPCEKCQISPLPENTLAFAVWEYVQDQVITTGMGVPVGINFQSVQIALEMLGIPDELRPECFRSVVTITRHMIALGRKNKGSRK